ncbi:hypothetical protein I2485_14695 [Nesterenkonia sp. E16_7]|uniref:hypothetical protein n=1 Tax=unclassified Nesterenkonia TaxID=2629769 RepID=UPI001A9392BC|nr:MULTISPECIES: hypothetical protein [unclassified Nesterenkonia]MBO0597007.1 hypothetical protein [Nesterenkonia sp. E16_10]MBO0599896.1 hypothetical protein [Nesterenkonia sp. E16_7]
MDVAPRLLLVTEDRALRDDVALIAATVGAALESRPDWEAVVPREWAVLMCGTDRLPPLSRLARGTLLLGITGEAQSQSRSQSPGEEQQLWKFAAEHPGLQPVPLPAGEAWLARHLGARVLDRNPGRVLAVTGVFGGVGASTVAYLLAAEQAVRGASVLLVDADPAPGAGLAGLLGGAEDRSGGRNRRVRSLHRGGGEAELGEALGWAELAALEGELASPQLAAALPIHDGFHVLSGAPGIEVRRRMLEPVVRSARRVFDTVIVDVGRDAEAVSLVREHLDQLLLVTPCTARGAAAARQLGESETGVPVRLVANGASHAGWNPQELAGATDLPLAGDIPEQRWLRREEALDAAYELLRSRRGAAFVGALLEVLDLEEQVRHE